MISQRLSALSSDVTDCSSTDCSCHCDTLDIYADHLVTTLLDCASQCLPTSKTSFHRKLVGWNSSARYLKEATNFWHKVWDEAGCPSSGVLFKIKKSAISRYKYAVVWDKLAHPFAMKRKGRFWSRFWSDVRRLNRSPKPCNH